MSGLDVQKTRVSAACGKMATEAREEGEMNQVGGKGEMRA